jgi:hypothetical protein
VKHSQALSDTALKPWVVVNLDGSVDYGHCNCKAGQGESCSHVAALLFALEATVQFRKNIACTSLPCAWKMPVFLDRVSYYEGKDIDFTAPSTKRKQQCQALCDTPTTPNTSTTDLNQATSTPSTSTPSTSTPSTPTPSTPTTPSTMRSTKVPRPPTEEEKSTFYSKLNNSKVKSAILSIVPEHSTSYIPKATQMDLPTPLDSLFDKDATDNNNMECVLEKCKDIFATMTVTPEQVSLII